MPRSLKIHIPEPCNEGWGTMEGDERRRFCERCQLHVVNLSALSDDEARRTLDGRVGGQRLCVHAMTAQDGTLISKTTQQQRLVDTLRELAEKRKKKP